MTIKITYEHTDGGYGMIIRLDDQHVKWLQRPEYVKVSCCGDGWWQIRPSKDGCVLKQRGRSGGVSARQHVPHHNMPHHGCVTLCIRYVVDNVPCIEFYENQPALSDSELPSCPIGFTKRLYGDRSYA